MLLLEEVSGVKSCSVVVVVLCMGHNLEHHYSASGLSRDVTLVRQLRSALKQSTSINKEVKETDESNDKVYNLFDFLCPFCRDSVNIH
jgi:hypothetical protein